MEPVNFAEMLENHEFRRWVRPALGRSTEADRECRLGVEEPVSGWPLADGSAVPAGLRGFEAGGGIDRGCAGAGVLEGGENDCDRVALSADDASVSHQRA